MSESNPKIMVVDDEPELLLTITEILEDAGYEVFGVDDGYKAIELASQEAFALVLMDIRLPGIHGVEAYRRIRSLCPGTPVIMMTGYAVESLVAQALEEGAYTVLYKPLDISVLLKAMEEVLDAPCILVVDDEPDARDSVRLIFEDLGYRVALAGNGNEAVTHAESKHYDVILMDIGMPGIDGFEACRQIVASDPSAKIIIVTAHEIGHCARQALMAGAFSLLSKPVEPENMVNLVDSLVRSLDTVPIGLDEAAA